MTKYFRKMMATVLILFALGALTGCQNDVSKSSSTDLEAVTIGCSPIRAAIIQDNTGSINWTGTPIVQVDDLEPLIQLLYRCGGEIGYGLISENSNKGLIRLFIDTAPVKPEEPARKGNPFKVAKKIEKYKHELEQFKREYALWKETAEMNVSKFVSDVELSMKKNKEAKRTDIWQAVRRADLFLSEYNNSWEGEPEKYALLISDGQDNVRKGKKVALNSKAKLLLVNASGSEGSLKEMNPLMFESIDSAIRFIINDSGKGGIE
jgi:hypothetical protein